ncbi:hypothetical protein [Streptomyces sp. NPDC047803]
MRPGFPAASGQPTLDDPCERGTSMDERMRDRGTAECGTATRT